MRSKLAIIGICIILVAIIGLKTLNNFYEERDFVEFFHAIKDMDLSVYDSVDVSSRGNDMIAFHNRQHLYRAIWDESSNSLVEVKNYIKSDTLQVKLTNNEYKLIEKAEKLFRQQLRGCSGVYTDKNLNLRINYEKARKGTYILFKIHPFSNINKICANNLTHLEGNWYYELKERNEDKLGFFMLLLPYIVFPIIIIWGLFYLFSHLLFNRRKIRS